MSSQHSRIGLDLQARRLSLSFDRHEVLHDIDLTLQRGWTAIVGPNGAGKSTLLKCLAGVLHPDRGAVLHGGADIAALGARERARSLAWMAQQSALEAELTAREVVALGRLPHLGLLGAPGAADTHAVEQAMQLTGSGDWQHRSIAQLSGGERQRTLLARVLAVQADVLLLDEPTAHLDPEHQVALVRLMQQLGRERTVVSVLHDLNLALLADRLVVMAAGRVVGQGASDDPAIHACLTEVFAQAVAIRSVDGQWLAFPVLGGGR